MLLPSSPVPKIIDSTVARAAPVGPISTPSGEARAEGTVIPGPWQTLDGWLPSSWGSNWNYWQLGYDPVSGCNSTAMVEACVSAYSQTIAMCPGSHWLANPDGGRTRQTNSDLYRILRRPNTYQSISDFLLNTTRSLFLEGNAYALALRNNRGEIAELHLMNPRSSGARVAQDGSVFYYLGGNEVVERLFSGLDLGYPALHYVPARDVLHIKLQTPRHPLKGESPLVAAALSIAAGNAMLQQQIQFYMNQAKPSFVLSTDLNLTGDQVTALREAWNKQSQGLGTGGTPILSNGLKPHTLSVSPEQAQLLELLKLTDQQVALVFRTPLQILGIGGTPFASTEALMQSWLAGGLQFALNHIETAFDNTFRLQGNPDEYTELDISTLLRAAEKDRIEALTSSISGGLRTINEARAKEDLPRVKGGDDIRVQQQDVPLDWHAQQLKLSKQKPQTTPAPVPEPKSREAVPDVSRIASTLLQSADDYDRCNP